MSWEAYRWTAKNPSELYQVLGPHGVDHLVRQMLDHCWRESPVEDRSLTSVKKIAQEVFDRNVAVWSRIKRPSPAAFFEDLRPDAADGFLRQAMVLCWMMMPRRGGRNIRDVLKIVAAIYDRNLTAWEHDDVTFTGKRVRVAKKSRSASVKSRKKSALAKRKKR